MPPPNANFTANLPVLQKVTDAYKLWHNTLPHMPRLTRHSLGQQISHLFVEVIELILTAGFAGREQKYPIIQKASVKLDTLKCFLQIGWQLKAFDNKKFAELSEPLAEAGKMLGGWQKQVLTQTPQPNGRGV